MDARVKRLIFRAHHMGMQENDIFFGAFADRHVPQFTDGQLDRFEVLLAENDSDLFDWVTGRQPVPASHDHDVMLLLRSFRLFSGRT